MEKEENTCKSNINLVQGLLPLREKAGRGFYKDFRLSLAAATTFSGVKPRFFRATLPGALAPNRSKVTNFPWSPAQRCQPKEVAASTTTRALTVLGRTS